MGEEQRQALARLFAENEEFKAALLSAASVEDAVRTAAEFGIEVSAEDLDRSRSGELGEVELDLAAGGGIWPTAPWVAC